MNISKLVKIELWKIMRFKNVLVCIIGELFCLIPPFVDDFSETKFQLYDIYLTQYMGMALTIRCIYISVVVSTLFSKDIENKLFDTYIAVGTKRSVIAIAKIFCLWILISCLIIAASFIYIVISFCFNGIDSIPITFIMSIVLSMLPLYVHSLLMIAIDVGFMNGFITTFSAVVLIVATSMLPHNITKWVYLSYNNPIVVYLYQEKEDILRMIGVHAVSTIAFLTINYQLMKEYGR